MFYDLYYIAYLPTYNFELLLADIIHFMIKKLFLKYGWLKTLRSTTLESYFTFNICIFLVPECHELIMEIIIIMQAILDSLKFHILPHLNNYIFA